jgi:hypothetical protein
VTLPTNVWLRRGLALAVGVIAAAMVYWVMNLPAASPVDDAKNWTLDAGDQVSLLGPTTGHVLTVQGPAGKGVGVRFANAALTPSSAAGLQAIGVAVNGQPSNVQWITEDGGVSRATVSLDLQPAGPRPALVVQLTSGDGVAELSFKGQDARLRVLLSGALVGTGTPPAEVTVGGQAFAIESGGALPIEVDAPPGAPFTVRFSQAAAGDAHLDWGGLLNTMQRMTVLDLTGVRVQRSDGSERVYACGAGPHDVAWRTMDVERLACQRTLRLQRLDLSPNGGDLDVIGSGFVIENGVSRVLSWSKAKDNPVLSGLAAAAFAGLTGWIVKMLLGQSATAPLRRGKTAP